MIRDFRGEHAFLSNFFPHDVRYNHATYRSAEHAFQAAKATTEADHDWILYAPSAKEAKRRGRIITLKENWDQLKDKTMKEILIAKFSNSTLQQKLVDTYPHELIEANWWGDTYWGVCNGIGENKLGKFLMEIRNGLRGKYPSVV